MKRIIWRINQSRVNLERRTDLYDRSIHFRGFALAISSGPIASNAA